MVLNLIIVFFKIRLIRILLTGVSKKQHFLALLLPSNLFLPIYFHVKKRMKERKKITSKNTDFYGHAAYIYFVNIIKRIKREKEEC